MFPKETRQERLRSLNSELRRKFLRNFYLFNRLRAEDVFAENLISDVNTVLYFECFKFDSCQYKIKNEDFRYRGIPFLQRAVRK